MDCQINNEAKLTMDMSEAEHSIRFGYGYRDGSGYQGCEFRSYGSDSLDPRRPFPLSVAGCPLIKTVLGSPGTRGWNNYRPNVHDFCYFPSVSRRLPD